MKLPKDQLSEPQIEHVKNLLEKLASAEIEDVRSIDIKSGDTKTIQIHGISAKTFITSQIEDVNIVKLQFWPKDDTKCIGNITVMRHGVAYELYFNNPA